MERYGPGWPAKGQRAPERDPVCVLCYELPSQHVDHVVPLRAGGSDEPANLRGICAACHSRKTAASDGGFGNPRPGRHAG